MLTKSGSISTATEIEDKGKEGLREDILTDNPLCWATIAGPMELGDITEGMQELELSDGGTPKAERLSLSDQAENENSDDLNLLHARSSHQTRPTLSRKAATAPPGTINVILPAPEPPRRAISARVVDGSRLRSNSEDVSPSSPRTPRTPRSAGPMPRSIITRRIKRITGRRVGLKPSGNVWRLSPSMSPKKMKAVSQLLNEGRGKWWDPERSSFSERSRVRETLNSKRVETLRTGIVNFGARTLPDTPSSVEATPRELYRDRTPSPSSPITSPTKGRRALQEISLNKRRSHSTPLTPVPWSVGSDHTTPTASSRRGSARSSRLTLRSGAVLAVFSPEESPWEKQVYVPGPIRVEKRFTESAMPRKASVASLEPFFGVVEELGGGPRRASDDAALADIIEHFEQLGIAASSDEDVLDRFWETSSISPGNAVSPAAPPTAVMPSSQLVMIPAPTARHNSTESVSRASLLRPRRRKLRRLLNSASLIM